jgi:opine dehydrogenase
MTEIAVLGGGHGSYAAAADLADRGFGVRLWRRSAKRLGRLRSHPRIELLDRRGAREAELELVTDTLADALHGVRLVIVPLPATAQESLAAALAAHLADGQVLHIPPGSFGSYAMARTLAEHGSRAAVAFVESGTLPYLARKRGEASVAISGRTTRLPSGAFPADRSDEALALVAEAYPELEPRDDALDAALLNAGPIIHPPLILMNAGPLEASDDYDIHAEGTQPRIRRVQDALDAERIAIREALGYRAPHFPLADHYEDGGEEWMYGEGAHSELVSSDDWREPLDLTTHRYMREDVAVGLAFLVSIGEWAGVPCPVARGLLAVASAVVGEDLRRTGRTLEWLGLAGLDRERLRRLLAHGLEAVPA